MFQNVVANYQIEKIIFSRYLRNVIPIICQKFIFKICTEIRKVWVFFQLSIHTSRRREMENFSLDQLIFRNKIIKSAGSRAASAERAEQIPVRNGDEFFQFVVANAAFVVFSAKGKRKNGAQ